LTASLKNPISVLVVIYTENGDVLLLNRTDRPGFWQSVTGSQNENETLLQTAQREVFEETGIDSTQHALTDLQQQIQYEIYPYFRHRYAASVTHNTEHWFSLKLTHFVSISIAPAEHTEYVWLSFADAIEKVFSPSNKKALKQVLPHQFSAKP